ncbi:MAG: MFS transporter [Chloroflexota bacterium]
MPSQPIGARPEQGAQANELRRNFNLGVISGVAYNLYVAILSTELVMTWFLSELTHSNLLISLLVPVEMGSWYFLQLILSGHVQQRKRALPIYQAMAAVRLVAIGGLTIATFVFPEPEPLLIVFMFAFSLNSVAAGVAALPFLNIVAKTIPPNRRGMYFAWRRAIGGLLGLLGGLLVTFLLSPASGLGFPENYGLLFFVGFWLTVLMVVPFSLVHEPEETTSAQGTRLLEQLRRSARLPSRDANYRRYLMVRVGIAAASYALPFYAVYARRVLGAPEDRVGIYLIGLTLTAVLSNLVSGQLGDRRGNRLLTRFAAATAILPSLTALLIILIPMPGVDKSLVFVLFFVFQGMHSTANSIGSNNYLLELAPSTERVLYIGIAHGVVGLTLFGSPLGGLIVDHWGFQSLFLFALACGVGAAGFSVRLNEPRRGQYASVT